jgi:acyl dehydratase
MTELQEGHARITDEMVDRLRSQIGVERRRRNAWTTQVTYDAVRHWAWGVGDDNPLFLDRSHGDRERLVAPSTILYSMHHGPFGPGARPSRGLGMPGIHGLHTGDYWEFKEPVQEGDSIEGITSLVDVEERQGKYASRQVWQTSETRFVRSDGALVAVLKHVSASTERGDSVKTKGKFSDASRWVYSDHEIEQIMADYAGEMRRGSEPRYWEDVNVGDDLGYVVKGPLTIQNMITFWSAWGCIFGMSDKIWYDYISAHPKAPFRDPVTNVPDAPDAGHYDERFAKEIGFPTGYDIGVQRICWFGHLMTNWMGDAGELLGLGVDLRRPNWLGDTTWLRGTVVGKEIRDGRPVVDCEMRGENQRHEQHSTATATIALPSKSA